MWVASCFAFVDNRVVLLIRSFVFEFFDSRVIGVEHLSIWFIVCSVGLLLNNRRKRFATLPVPDATVCCKAVVRLAIGPAPEARFAHHGLLLFAVIVRQILLDHLTQSSDEIALLFALRAVQIGEQLGEDLVQLFLGKLQFGPAGSLLPDDAVTHLVRVRRAGVVEDVVLDALVHQQGLFELFVDRLLGMQDVGDTLDVVGGDEWCSLGCFGHPLCLFAFFLARLAGRSTQESMVVPRESCRLWGREGLFVAASAHLFHELGDLLVAGVSLVVTSLAALALGAAACENYQQTNAANNKVE